jgi:hypothetical protein
MPFKIKKPKDNPRATALMVLGIRLTVKIAETVTRRKPVKTLAQ